MMRWAWGFESLEKTLYRGGDDATGAGDDTERANNFRTLVGQYDESTSGYFCGNGRVGEEGYSCVNFDSLFEGFDVIKLHHRLKLEATGGKNSVETLAGGHFGCERDNFCLGQLR